VRNLTWQNPEPLGSAASLVEELLVAQVLIKKVKLKCCGIKVKIKTKTMHKSLTRRYAGILLSATLLALTAGCTKDSATVSAADVEKDTPVAVSFDTYLQNSRQSTRSTYPAAPVGMIDDAQLKTSGFGVFAQYAGSTAWTSYTDKATTPFNFMWNQQVDWTEGSSAWTYSPVKYWPNDNNPADDQDAQGSQKHSYLSFFAYAPYVSVATPGSGFDANSDDDGIVQVTGNGTSIAASSVYYRTSIEKPFGEDKSVDLLWATKQDCYKYDGTSDANDDGRVNDRVDLVFKHALTKLLINVRAMVDRTANNTSPAYSTDLDANTKIFIDNVSITTPAYYTEGILKVAPNATVPTWDYTGLDASSYQKTLFRFGSDVDLAFANVNSTKDLDQVKYSLRYAAPNVPTNATIDDDDHDDIDDNTGLTLVETARAAFDEMEAGVIATEQQMSANYSTFMFCPSAATSDISIRAVYHVVTFDPNLTLNNPKFYSDVTNNIRATLDDATFKFEPNKQYKILLNLGVTSVKFEVYVLDDSGEWILLSAVVKEWDLVTKEVDVE